MTPVDGDFSQGKSSKGQNLEKYAYIT